MLRRVVGSATRRSAARSALAPFTAFQQCRDSVCSGTIGTERHQQGEQPHATTAAQAATSGGGPTANSHHWFMLFESSVCSSCSGPPGDWGHLYSPHASDLQQHSYLAAAEATRAEAEPGVPVEPLAEPLLARGAAARQELEERVEMAAVHATGALELDVRSGEKGGRATQPPVGWPAAVPCRLPQLCPAAFPPCCPHPCCPPPLVSPSWVKAGLRGG